LYLAYIRAAFHTCYYCSIVSDHLEELQRKCLTHARKPLSTVPPDEARAAETEKSIEGDKEKEPEKESLAKEKPNESKDWRRNGVSYDCIRNCVWFIAIPCLDERWLEWLDSKVALLINRNGVDPRDYGGKSYDE
jgi:hypothetical protein